MRFGPFWIANVIAGLVLCLGGSASVNSGLTVGTVTMLVVGGFIIGWVGAAADDR